MSQATRLRILRGEKFSSQLAFANALNISQGEVSLLERNLMTPREDIQDKLEEIFNLPYKVLCQPLDLTKLAMDIPEEELNGTNLNQL